jgi:hypothetical protein
MRERKGTVAFCQLNFPLTNKSNKNAISKIIVHMIFFQFLFHLN